MLGLEVMLISLTMQILSIPHYRHLFGRMIEIFTFIIYSTVPFATLTNKEWGGIGNNYLKGLLALVFQDFHDGLRGNLCSFSKCNYRSSDLHASIWSVAA